MERRKIIGAAVFSAAIAGGGVAGVVLGSPASSSAATSSPSTTAPGQRPMWGFGRRGPDGDGFHMGVGRGETLDAAAKAIGVSTDTLQSDLRGGKTIAQVAASKNVAVQTVVDAMVAAATAQIDAQVKAGHLPQAMATKLEANLESMITNVVNGKFTRPVPPMGPNGPGRGFGFRGGFGLDAAAKAIGVSTDTLETGLKGGKTIAQVAASKHVAVTTVVNAMVAAAKSQIDAQVKAGHLPAAVATKIEANLTQMITDQVNGTFKRPPFPGGPGGFGGRFRGGWIGGPPGSMPGAPTSPASGTQTNTSGAPTV